MRRTVVALVCLAISVGMTPPFETHAAEAFPMPGLRPLSVGETEVSGPWDDVRAGRARPTALAQGDFDGDGVPDLVVGYAGDDGGFVTLQRGNVDSIFPHSVEARQRRAEGRFTDQPFLTPATVFDAPVPPDFLDVGDFDNDGNLDVVVGARGGETLHLLAGDGAGELQAAEAVELPGALTAMVTGEINRRDGVADLVVGVRGSDGFGLLVFEGPEGALRSTAEVLPVPAEPTALLLARLGDAPWIDLAAAAGDELIIVRGRDRQLVLGEERRAEVAPPVVEGFAVPSAIESLAWGDFTGSLRHELALLLEDGTIRLLDGTGDVVGQRDVLAPRDASSPAVPSRLLSVKVSGAPGEDLAIFDVRERRLSILAGDAGVVGSLDLPEPAVAALPMRLNRDALTDLVLLLTGSSTPLLAETSPLAVITVNTDLDSETPFDELCSLREAINNANWGQTTGVDCVAGAIGADAIEFNIGGGGAEATIALTSQLPAITSPVTIDGTTQGCGSPPCVALDGSAAGAAVNGLTLSAGSNTIRGLAISSFDNHGILATSSENIVEACFIGTDLTGTVAQGNHDGVHIENGSNNTVGGTIADARNIISGNGDDGVSTEPGNGNQILGNYIGTDVGGTLELANGWGVFIMGTSSGNTVGGASPGAGNLVSANTNHGVYIRDAGVTGNQVLGNRIGTDFTGTAPLGNGVAGLRIDQGSNNIVGGTSPGAGNLISANGANGAVLFNGASANQVLGNFIGTDATGTVALGNGLTGAYGSGVFVTQASNNIVGGTAPGAGNLISRNFQNGIEFYGNSTGNLVLGNLIGTDVTGMLALGNLENGVLMNSSNNIVGGTAFGAGNLISDNALDGVHLHGVGITGNRFLGNRIGTDVSGAPVLGNGESGIDIFHSFSNTVGGTIAGAANLIAGNALEGVSVEGSSAAFNAILGNSIFDNGLLGIDLAVTPSDGITPNDPWDFDTGPNGLQNFPSLDSVDATPAGVNIQGSLNSNPNGLYRVEFFTSAVCDASGYGEAERFLGFTDVVTDFAGNGSFNVVLPAPVSDGDLITTTATNAQGDTSELCGCVTAVCQNLAIFGETITAPDTNTWVWSVPQDIRFAKGELVGVGSHTTTDDGTLFGATSLDMSMDTPASGDGLYYVVRPLGCGSWQTVLGQEPGRDAALP